MFLRSENNDFARRELYRSAVQTPAQSRANAKGIKVASRTPHGCGCHFYRMWANPNNVPGLFPSPFLKPPNTILAFFTNFGIRLTF